MIGKRVELDGKNVEKGGQQFVNGRGLKSDGYTSIHRIEPHGFASSPVKGAQGLLIAPNADADQVYVLGCEHPSLRPKDLPNGGSALYDAHGNIMKFVMGDGVTIDVAGSSYTIRKGGVSLTISDAGVAIEGGTVTHNGKNIGDTHIHSGVNPGAGNTSVPV